MSSDPQTDGPKPGDNPNRDSEWQQKTLEFHTDIGKTLILAISVLMTISLAFVSSKGLSSISWWGRGFAGVGLFSVFIALIFIAKANNRILSISKKLDGTQFKYDPVNQIEKLKYWDDNLHSATSATNWALYIFIVAIILLGISGVVFLPSDKSVADLFSSLSKELEMTKRMTPPLLWESVVYDKNKEVYNFVVTDGQNKKIYCEVDTDGKINHCRP